MSNGKTYEPLYTYYLPIGYLSPKGYYSTLHKKTYYDGYGYNFYTGKYGYYETSEVPTDWADIATAVGIVFCCVCCSVIQAIRSCTDKDDEDYESEEGKKKNIKVVEV